VPVDNRCVVSYAGTFAERSRSLMSDISRPERPLFDEAVWAWLGS
jgi:hypothetical protein